VVTNGSGSASGGCVSSSPITYYYGYATGQNTGQGSWYYIPSTLSTNVTLINFSDGAGGFFHIYVDTALKIHCDWALGGASGTSDTGTPVSGHSWYWINGHVARPSAGHVYSDCSVFDHPGSVVTEFFSPIVTLASPGSISAQVGYGVC